jgi:hypothetical protein
LRFGIIIECVTGCVYAKPPEDFSQETHRRVTSKDLHSEKTVFYRGKEVTRLHLSEATRRARSNLYNLESNAALLERQETLVEMIREHGSRVEQRYDEKPGRAKARYIESVPAWFLELGDTERALWELIDAATSTAGLVKYIERYEPELFEFYAAKYRDGYTIPDLKKQFGKNLKRLDRDLVFRLIDWHGWRIDEPGGEDYGKWIEARGCGK